MAAPQGDKPVRRLVGSVTKVKWGAKAKEVAASLKAQHAAGLAGDETPTSPIWPTPKEQFEAVKHLLRPSSKVPAISAGETRPADAQGVGNEPLDETALDDDAEQVARALRGVDWAEVRAATSERAGDVTRTMRSLAESVDWAKVQPVAAQVSSALIAAVAAGRIPVGGRLGPIVVRAITDQNNLGRRVATNLDQTPAAVPTDFRTVIEATARES